MASWSSSPPPSNSSRTPPTPEPATTSMGNSARSRLEAALWRGPVFRARDLPAFVVEHPGPTLFVAGPSPGHQALLDQELEQLLDHIAMGTQDEVLSPGL